MPNPFALQSTFEDGFSVIRLEGYLDAHTAPQFEQAVQSELDQGRTRFIVDCEKLTYISSAGLGVFMSFIEEIREQGGDIKICGLTPKVRQVFDILGFPELFDMCANREAAVQRFAESPLGKGAES
ncbi:MAG: STAS domain-containing protein [Pyrinomonadaceae bacterium]|nr:STAS domain-containing protein [Pyrinomonadaceae bacterium]